MNPIIEAILTEQIAGLRASATTFVQQRAASLAAAQSASVQEGGATARADELQAALDAYRAEHPVPDEPVEEIPDEVVP